MEPSNKASTYTIANCKCLHNHGNSSPAIVHKLKVKEIPAVIIVGKRQEQLAEGLRTAVKQTANKAYNLVANVLASLCFILGCQLP